ncbi:MAG: hypothetical protein L6R36_003114 [Xanthoria steineri]|nr:MAG: hypothetical protein LQ339_002865 [Xanthoria mediterranea]KAI4226518.1 MAG: hypothetical protein L6R36_003114 [Xanthoria steineri]
MVKLSAARYGKDNIRVYKVHRNNEAGTQDVVEMTVGVLLLGDIETSYTEADNSVVVATDTMKNTVYVLAKQHPVSPPELFGSIVASHFVDTYKHIHSAQVKIIVHKWTRMTVDGKPHPHSFFRDGADTRNVEAVATEGKGVDVRSAIAGLLVLKSTGSAFHGFIRDEYATLPEVSDRILSTSVDCGWAWETFPNLKDVEDAVPKFDDAWNSARQITVETFAKDNSASVQNTMYKMCEQILSAVPMVKAVDYSLPNKHYFEIDLSWHKGLKNTGKDAEVYAPQSDPNGLIQCTVSR